MFRRLQQLLSYPRWRYFFALGIVLLLTACGDVPDNPVKVEATYNDCWPCSAYTTTFTAIQKSMVELINICCTNAFTLLGICLLFWMLFHIGKFLVTIQQPNFRKFVFPMTTVFFKAVIVAALIGAGDAATGNYYLTDFMGDIVQPVMDFFAKVSRQILDSNDLVKEATQAVSVEEYKDTLSTDFKQIVFNPLFGADTSEIERSESVANDLIAKSVAGQLLDIVYRIYIALKMGVSLGFNLWHQGNSLTNASASLVSILIIFMFWMLMLTMPMSFLDAIVRIAAVAILAPFALVGWVFPPTKWMIGRVWGVLLGSGLTLMFSCFYVALTVFVVTVYAEKNYPGIFGTTTQSKDPNLLVEVQGLSTTIVGFFVLILCMNRLSGFISKLANQFGGEAPESSFIKAFQGVKKLSLAATKTAIAVAVASPTLAKQAWDETKEVAKSVAQDAGQNKGG